MTNPNRDLLKLFPWKFHRSRGCLITFRIFKLPTKPTRCYTIKGHQASTMFEVIFFNLALHPFEKI